VIGGVLHGVVFKVMIVHVKDNLSNPIGLDHLQAFYTRSGVRAGSCIRITTDIERRALHDPIQLMFLSNVSMVYFTEDVHFGVTTALIVDEVVSR
jgi:hypothetical protein